MNHNTKDTFSKRYTFVASPHAYKPLSQLRLVNTKLVGWKEAFMAKIPYNLRTSRLASNEKSFITLVILFWATVEYLGRHQTIQRDTPDTCIDRQLASRFAV